MIATARRHTPACTLLASVSRRPAVPNLLNRASAPCSRSLRRRGLEFEPRAVVAERLLIVLDRCILRFGQNADQGRLIERLQRRDYRAAADELG